MMFEEIKKIKSNEDTSTQQSLSSSVEEIIEEIYQIPKEHLPRLCQIIRLFRECLNVTNTDSDTNLKEFHQKMKTNPHEQHQVIIRLLKEWEEEGDEKEQTETWEFLRQALDEDRLSNRQLFP